MKKKEKMKDEYIPVKTYKKWSLEIDKEPKNVIHTFGQIFYLGIKSTSAETNRLFSNLIYLNVLLNHLQMVMEKRNINYM